MNINIVEGIEVAKGLSDTVVVIDVFRASNTILAALSKGAKEIHVADNEKAADDLRKRYQGSLFFGEHMGDKLPDANYTNSPSETYSLDLTGRTIVLLTTMGSRVIAAPKNANEILVASFGNVTVIADYLKKSQSGVINLVACGELGDRALEDYECAKYIQGILQSKEVDFTAVKDTILASSHGAKRLKDKGQGKDLEICLKLDYSQIVPYVNLQDGGVVLRAK